jgi:hypothetical protein
MAEVCGTVRNVHGIMGCKHRFLINIAAVLEGYARFEVAVKIAVFQDVTPCSLVDLYRRFGGNFCHCYLPDRRQRSAGLHDVTSQETVIFTEMYSSVYQLM